VSPELVAVGLLALVALFVAGFAVYVVRTLPEVPQLSAVVRELLERVNGVDSAIAGVRRDFHALENGVEHHLDVASTRQRRAIARETAEKRTRATKAAPEPSGPRALTIDEQFELEEQKLSTWEN